MPIWKDGDAKLTADDLQLLNGGGTIDVTGYQQGLLAVFFHETGELCTVGGFTGA